MINGIVETPRVVLVVDDDPRILSILCDFIKSDDFQVLDALSGNLAIEILKSQNVDLILSDIKMPNGNGMELLQWVKSNNFRSPPLLLITGGEDVSTPDALDAGADDLILKPIDRESLLAAIHKAKIQPDDRWRLAPPSVELFSYHLELQMLDLESALSSGVIEFGRGGIFLHLDNSYPLSFERIRFSFTFSSGPLRRLAGDGLVRWARPHASRGYKNGIGIEFRYVEPEAHDELNRIIKDQRIIAFIPAGRAI